jgi:hypothetical protein
MAANKINRGYGPLLHKIATATGFNNESSERLLPAPTARQTG